MSVPRTDVSEVPLPCSAKRNRILFRAAGVVQSCITHPVAFTVPPLHLCSSTFNTSPRLVFTSPVSNIVSCLCKTATVPSFYTICYFIIPLAMPSDSPHLTQGDFYMWTSGNRNWVFRKSFAKSDCYPHHLACLSVLPPVRIEQNSRMRFRETSYFGIFTKIGHTQYFGLKSDILFHVFDTVCVFLTVRAQAEKLVRKRNTTIEHDRWYVCF